jgi:heptosyltransferase I
MWKFPLSEEDKSWAKATLGQLPRPLVAIHPCTSKAERNWPFECYVELISKVLQQHSVSFVFTGGNNNFELDFCARLTQLAGNNALDLCGQTSPKQLAAILGAADVLIAPDTAAVHLARAMDTPVVGLYAVASPKLSGPYQRDEFIVNRYPDALRKFLGKDVSHVAWNTRVHHPEAMDLITADDVLKQVTRALQR